MSRLNKNKWILYVFVAYALITLSLGAQEETNDILVHYQKRAGEVFNGRHPLFSGVNFSFEATRYYIIYDKNDEQQIVDSMFAKYFYSFGKQDSVTIELLPENSFDSLDINYPNMFIGDYTYNFFPNDTGGNELSIGYDSKEFNPDIPVGIAVIDRDRYFLTRLYMHYMNFKRINRSSKSFRFIEYEGFVFPDSIWELKSRSSLVATEYYRIETGIQNIKIQR